MLCFQNAFRKLAEAVCISNRKMVETFSSFSSSFFLGCVVYFICFLFCFSSSLSIFSGPVSICCSLCTPYTRGWKGVLSFSICCASYTLCIAQCQPLFPNEQENLSQGLLFCSGGLRRLWKLSFDNDLVLHKLVEFTHYIKRLHNMIEILTFIFSSKILTQVDMLII